jgi:hypothetical protein
MSAKRKMYTAEFKREAVSLITNHGYGVFDVAKPDQAWAGDITYMRKHSYLGYVSPNDYEKFSLVA